MFKQDSFDSLSFEDAVEVPYCHYSLTITCCIIIKGYSKSNEIKERLFL